MEIKKCVKSFFIKLLAVSSQLTSTRHTHSFTLTLHCTTIWLRLYKLTRSLSFYYNIYNNISLLFAAYVW